MCPCIQWLKGIARVTTMNDVFKFSWLSNHGKLFCHCWSVCYLKRLATFYRCLYAWWIVCILAPQKCNVMIDEVNVLSDKFWSDRNLYISFWFQISLSSNVSLETVLYGWFLTSKLLPTVLWWMPNSKV